MQLTQCMLQQISSHADMIVHELVTDSAYNLQARQAVLHHVIITHTFLASR
jgi:hypothetical protein